MKTSPFLLALFALAFALPASAVSRTCSSWAQVADCINSYDTIKFNPSSSSDHHIKETVYVYRTVTLNLYDEDAYRYTWTGTAIVVGNGGTLTLVNGTIDGRKKAGRLIEVQPGGKLILNGATLCNARIDSADGAAVYINGNGTFEMKDGVIDSCIATKGSGGAVWNNGGTFTMSGGGIYGCNGTSTAVLGGAIRNTSGTFNMTGGLIYECYASNYRGGAVYNFAGATFNMSGGTIQGCYAADGGGVYNAGTFKMTGGTIKECGANPDTGAGGNIYNAGTMTINASTSLNNGSAKYGGSICNSGTATVSCSWISGCSAYYGGAVCCSGSGASLTLLGGNIYGNSGNAGCAGAALSGGYLKVNGANVDADQKPGWQGAMFAQGGTIELAGGDIKKGTANTSEGGGAVTLYDNATFKMTGGFMANNTTTTGNGGAVYLRNSNCTFEMSGGDFYSCSAPGNGGAAWIGSGTFKMTGGTIRNCSAANGGVIAGSGKMTFSGGTIKDSSASGGGGGIYMTGGTLDLTGGTISGCTANYGGGVRISAGATTLSGTTIKGNRANGNGNGLQADGKLTLNITGGEISGNYDYNSCSYGGAGLLAYDGTTVNISGGKIINNKTSGNGVIYFRGAEMNITGGVFTGNTVTGTKLFYRDSGATGPLNVYGLFSDLEPASNSSGITIPAGYKECEIAASKYVVGRNVLAEDGGVGRGAFTFNPTNEIYTAAGLTETTGTAQYNMTDPVTTYVVDKPHDHCICGDGACTAAGHVHGDIAFRPWIGETTLPTSAGDWYLFYDVNLAAVHSAASGVNLCLNGNVVKAAENCRVATVGSGVTWQLTDCATNVVHNFAVGEDTRWNLVNDPATTNLASLVTFPATGTVVAVTGGALTGGRDSHGGGIYNYGVLNLYAGNIVGNEAIDYTYGGGLYNYGGTVTMYGGGIIGNTSGEYGGGVCGEGGVFTLEDGAISFNSAYYDGGFCHWKGTLTMKGGSVSGNVADYYAGISSWDDDNEFVMTGGEITGNTASNEIGGVNLCYGDMTVGGTAKIIGNTAGGAPVNVYLSDTNSIAVSTSVPLSNAVIGVTTEVKPAGETLYVPVTSNRGEDYACFSSDDNRLTVVEEGGRVQLKAPIVTFEGWGGFCNDAEAVRMSVGVDFLYCFPIAFTREGYAQTGWYQSWTNGAAAVVQGDPIVTNADHSVYAHWESETVEPVELKTEVSESGLAVTGTDAAVTNGVLAIPDLAGDATDAKAYVKIGEYAFSRKNYDKRFTEDTLTSVAIPTYVKEIGSYAFQNCASVTNLTFAPTRDYATGAKVPLVIREWAFHGTQVSEVRFPAGSSVVLGEGAFAYADNLTDIYIDGEVSAEKNAAPFASIAKKSGTVTIHLAPALAADADYVYSLTNGMNAARVKLSQQIEGEVGYVGTPDVTSDPMVFTFTVKSDSPWLTVNADTVYLFWSKELNPQTFIGNEPLYASEVVDNCDGTYTAKFARPDPATGAAFFQLCVGE